MPKTIIHINVAKIALVVGGCIVAYKYLDVISNSDDETKSKLNDKVSSAISFAKWRLL